MDDIAKAIAALDERRNAPAHAVLTKDADPQPITKADSDSGMVAGNASDFWMVDSWAEATAPGSFAKTIAERGPSAAKPRIVARYEHEHTIGTYRSLSETGTSLESEAHVSDDGMWGTVVRSHLKDEIPYGLSIGYRVIESRPATADDPLNFSTSPQWVTELAKQDIGSITVLTEVKLMEISVVTFPAVDTALVTNYRSDLLDLPQRHIDALLRDAKRGVLTGDHITHLRALAQTLPAAMDPNGETPEPVQSQTAETRRNYYELRFQLAELGIPV